jgi:hypothetical protein
LRTATALAPPVTARILLENDLSPAQARIVKNQIILLATLAVLLAGCATTHEAQWHTYDAGPFTFSLRSDFRKTSAHGIDSYASVFESRSMQLGFDYGDYSGDPLDNLSKDPNSFQPRPSYASHIESIAGHKVQIISVDLDPHHNAGFPYFIAASFLKARLTMSVRCKTTEDYEDATRIFRSVSFKQQ